MGVYIVLLKIGLVYLDLNFLILLILVPLHTLPKISSAHLMQSFQADSNGTNPISLSQIVKKLWRFLCLVIPPSLYEKN